QPDAGFTEILPELSINSAGIVIGRTSERVTVEVAPPAAAAIIEAAKNTSDPKKLADALAAALPAASFGTLTSGALTADELKSLKDDHGLKKTNNSFLIQLGSFGPDQVTLNKTAISGESSSDRLNALATAIQNAVQNL